MQSISESQLASLQKLTSRLIWNCKGYRIAKAISFKKKKKKNLSRDWPGTGTLNEG